MFNIKKVTIVRIKGHTDKVEIEVDGPSPFPESNGKYPPYLSIETKAGYAEQWLKVMHVPMNLVEVILAK